MNVCLFNAVNFAFKRADGTPIASCNLLTAARLYACFQKLAEAADVNSEFGISDAANFSIRTAGENHSVVGLSVKTFMLGDKDLDAFAFICGHEIAHIHHQDRERSHATEFRADRTALEFMRKAGFDTAGAVRALNLLPPHATDTHPTPKERIEALSDGNTVS